MTGPRGQPEPDAYKVLQVDSEADPEIIQAAHRRLVQKYHPDRAPGPDAQTRMIAINAAWEILGDPARRSAYDARRANGTAGDSRSPSDRGPSSTPSRDQPGDHRADVGANRGADMGAGPRAGSVGGAAQHPPQPSGPQTVSRDWTSGRSSIGSGYEADRMRTADGDGAAGPPPGRPAGSVLNFGRYAGWSLGEIARTDLEYLEWLDRMTIGRTYREELDGILRAAGRRRSAAVETDRRGLFRRR